MIFDIKGSTVNRKSEVAAQFWRKDFNQRKTMKDMNFVEISQDSPLVKLEPR